MKNAALRFTERTVEEQPDIASRDSILDQIPEAIFAIGTDGTITYFNQACVDLAGRTPLIGRDAWCAMWKIYDENGVEVAPEESAVATSLHTATPLRGGELTGERPDGSRFQFLYHTTPLFEDGTISGALALLIDITARKEAEARLDELESEVLYLSRVAAMGAMASVLVHELSQPLAAVSNYVRATERLVGGLEAGTAEKVRAALKETIVAIDRANETLRSVKQMVQRKPSRISALSLTDLVRDVEHLLPGWRSLEYRIDPDADRVLADKIQIEQVLFNLIKNACEAIEGQPGGKVIVAARRVAIMVEVSVSDNGPGIAAHARGDLFSPFNSSKSEGLGVGLSICRAIVEHHHGNIWLANHSGGAKFCFTLPAAPAGSKSAAPQESDAR